MGLIIGLSAVLTLFVGVPLILYLFAIGKTKATNLPSGGMSIVLVALLFGAIWWYFDSKLLLVTAGLIASGTAIQLWSKAPASAKSIAGWMIGSGAILGALLLILGPEALEYRRDQVVSVAAGKSLPLPPTPEPLKPEEQAARLERGQQDAEVQRLQAASDASASIAARIAAELPVITPGCPGTSYQGFRDCRKVFFTSMNGYQVENVSDGCLLAHDNSLVNWEALSEGTYVARPVRPGIEVMFFVASFGQVFRVSNSVCTARGLEPRL